MKYAFYCYAFALIIYLWFDIKMYGKSDTTNSILNLIAWLFAIIFIVLIVIAITRKTRIKKENIQKQNNKTFCANDMKIISAEQPKIYKKRQFLTESEKEFLHKLRDVYKYQYTIQAQIPLRMIIEKDTDSWKYANELTRYIDFGILDENEDIIALIELNDYTHHQKDRIIRDNKVRDICRQAQIPLIEIWNKDIPNEELKQIIDKEIL